ncbi:MAG: cobalt-precorrin 5A hydrolase [Acetatifactor sp.]|nr:cobalt-precorrin 5A hydrolase [Acetatifactor sp.]
MIIRIISFTKNGNALAKRISEFLIDDKVEIIDSNDSVEDTIKDSFEYGIPLIFIGSMGIAVRKISPYIKDKLTDPPVIVLDEKGEFVIPVLSGHVGGGNRLSRFIAEGISSKAVITTATDVNGKFSVDEFATENDMLILNRDGIKRVAKKVLEGESVSVFFDENNEFSFEKIKGILKKESNVKIAEPDKKDPVDICITSESKKDLPGSLILIPKRYVLGIGCKKGTDVREIENFVNKVLNKYGIDIKEVGAVASIDLKRNETGILKFASKIKAKTYFYDSETLNRAEGDFSESDFVKQVTGVSNVCERAAVTAAGKDCETIIKKIVGNGITLALTKRKY